MYSRTPEKNQQTKNNLQFRCYNEKFHEHVITPFNVVPTWFNEESPSLGGTTHSLQKWIMRHQVHEMHVRVHVGPLRYHYYDYYSFYDYCASVIIEVIASELQLVVRAMLNSWLRKIAEHRL
jgi:hypothetical protein